MIIAIVPSPGHEALVAAGDREPNHPAVRVERPMTIGRCKCGAYACRSHYLDGHGHSDGPVALVLHAPGGPKLGMLRAMEATETAKVSGSLGHDAVCGPFVVVREVGRRVPYTMDVPAPPDGVIDGPMVSAWGVAHLLVQRGIAAEVIVLPADKAKE